MLPEVELRRGIVRYVNDISCALDPILMPVKLMIGSESLLVVGLLVLEDSVDAAFQARHPALYTIHTLAVFIGPMLNVLVGLGELHAKLFVLLVEALIHLGILFLEASAELLVLFLEATIKPLVLLVEAFVEPRILLLKPLVKLLILLLESLVEHVG